jgi:hypothetical protein
MDAFKSISFPDQDKLSEHNRELMKHYSELHGTFKSLTDKVEELTKQLMEERRNRGAEPALKLLSKQLQEQREAMNKLIQASVEQFLPSNQTLNAGNPQQQELKKDKIRYLNHHTPHTVVPAIIDMWKRGLEMKRKETLEQAPLWGAQAANVHKVSQLGKDLNHKMHEYIMYIHNLHQELRERTLTLAREVEVRKNLEDREREVTPALSNKNRPANKALLEELARTKEENTLLKRELGEKGFIIAQMAQALREARFQLDRAFEDILTGVQLVTEVHSILSTQQKSRLQVTTYNSYNIQHKVLTAPVGNYNCEDYFQWKSVESLIWTTPSELIPPGDPIKAPVLNLTDFAIPNKDWDDSLDVGTSAATATSFPVGNPPSLPSEQVGPLTPFPELKADLEQKKAARNHPFGPHATPIQLGPNRPFPEGHVVDPHNPPEFEWAGEPPTPYICYYLVKTPGMEELLEKRRIQEELITLLNAQLKEEREKNARWEKNTTKVLENQEDLLTTCRSIQDHTVPPPKAQKKLPINKDLSIIIPKSKDAPSNTPRALQLVADQLKKGEETPKLPTEKLFSWAPEAKKGEEGVPISPDPVLSTPMESETLFPFGPPSAQAWPADGPTPELSSNDSESQKLVMDVPPAPLGSGEKTAVAATSGEPAPPPPLSTPLRVKPHFSLFSLSRKQ